MRLRVLIPVFAAATISVFGFVGSAFAHAHIGSVDWDNPANPTKVIATSEEDDIKTTPGSFILQVFNVQGDRVDVGSPTVSSTDPTMMSVAVKPNLPSGGYRVQWQTLSADDGDEDDGSFTLLLNKPAAPAVVVPAPAAPAAPALAVPASPAPAAAIPATPRQVPVLPPSTGDAGLLATGNHSRGIEAIEVVTAAVASFGLFGLLRKRA